MGEMSRKILLILGGRTIASYDIVRYAKEIGAYVIVADYLSTENSPAKQIADESWNISTADVDELSRLANAKKVSSVFAGVHEFNIERALSVSELLGLPFYITREQWELTTNKIKYKKLFKEFNIHVAEEYKISTPILQKEISNIVYPVIVKPADRSGGFGISICENKTKLKDSVEKASLNSTSNQVIIEQYISGEEITIFYAIQNGNICLAAVADRHVQHFMEGIIPLPVAYIFPSKYLVEYQKTLNERVIAAFKSIRLLNGMVFIQALVKNGKFYFYDMGCRLTGTQEYHLLSRTTGLNLMEMMVNLSLFGKMAERDIREIANPNFDSRCCNLTFLAKPGKIGQYIGLETVSLFPEVVAVVPAYRQGDTIPDSAIGTLKQVVLRIFAICSSFEVLGNVINRIQNTIRVNSTEGENMIVSSFSTELLPQ